VDERESFSPLTWMHCLRVCVWGVRVCRGESQVNAKSESAAVKCRQLLLFHLFFWGLEIVLYCQRRFLFTF